MVVLKFYPMKVFAPNLMVFLEQRLAVQNDTPWVTMKFAIIWLKTSAALYAIKLLESIPKWAAFKNSQ